MTDGDADGVADDLDSCPGTAAAAVVDSAGCSDGQVDNDGVRDSGATNVGPSVCTGADNRPRAANADQTDADGDSNGDVCDDDDNDGILDTQDSCPLTSNPAQFNNDGDTNGDACDNNDNDNDGVIDAADACMSTAVGEAVNVDGCALAELCPCDNLWKNHGAYVSCLAHATNDFVAVNLIRESEKSAIVSVAGLLSCGAKESKKRLRERRPRGGRSTAVSSLPVVFR